MPARPMATMATPRIQSRIVTRSAYARCSVGQAIGQPFTGTRSLTAMRSLTLLAAAAIAAAVFMVAAPRPQAQGFSAPAGAVDAPNPDVPLYFEAASLKPSDPKAGPGMGIRRQPGGRFNTFNTTVRVLITFAYQIQDYQLVEAPDWIKNTRYDIVAKMEGDPPPVRPGTG